MLYRGPVHHGPVTYEWDGRNDTGEQVGDGVYFVEAALGDERAHRKIVRISR